MNAVVLFSGGQDSTTCLAWAMQEYERVVAVTFDYGQRHAVEVEQAAVIAERWGVDLVVLPIDTLRVLGDAALTNPDVTVEGVAGSGSGNSWAARRGLPSTFVPGRNLLFFTLAAAYGLPRGFDALVTGICEADAAGYPDCRAGFAAAAQVAIAAAMDATAFRLRAPLLSLTKADTWRMADRLGVLDVIRFDTHTCYQGVRDQLHSWGYGCGSCPACSERRRGYEEAFPTGGGTPG